MVALSNRKSNIENRKSACSAGPGSVGPLLDTGNDARAEKIRPLRAADLASDRGAGRGRIGGAGWYTAPVSDHRPPNLVLGFRSGALWVVLSSRCGARRAGPAVD